LSIYRCAVRISNGAENYFNIFHISLAGSNAQGVAEDFSDLGAASAYLNVLPSSVVLEDITVTKLDDMTQGTHVISTNGTVSGDVCPPQDSAVITWRTSMVGRRYRGRTYVPCIPESAQQFGVLTAPHQSSLEDLADALVNGWADGMGGSLVVFHKDLNTSTDIINWIVRATIRSQRRRQLGVGT